MPTVRQLQAVVLHLVVFHLLTRWVGSRHATSASLSPSKPVRPHFSDLNYISAKKFCQYGETVVKLGMKIRKKTKKLYEDADLKKMGTVPFSPYIKDERDNPLFMNNLA